MVICEICEKEVKNWKRLDGWERTAIGDICPKCLPLYRKITNKIKEVLHTAIEDKTKEIMEVIK